MPVPDRGQTDTTICAKCGSKVLFTEQDEYGKMLRCYICGYRKDASGYQAPTKVEDRGYQEPVRFDGTYQKARREIRQQEENELRRLKPPVQYEITAFWVEPARRFSRGQTPVAFWQERDTRLHGSETITPVRFQVSGTTRVIKGRETLLVDNVRPLEPCLILTNRSYKHNLRRALLWAWQTEHPDVPCRNWHSGVIELDT